MPNLSPESVAVRRILLGLSTSLCLTEMAVGLGHTLSSGTDPDRGVVPPAYQYGIQIQLSQYSVDARGQRQSSLMWLARESSTAHHAQPPVLDTNHLKLEVDC